MSLLHSIPRTEGEKKNGYNTLGLLPTKEGKPDRSNLNVEYMLIADLFSSSKFDTMETATSGEQRYLYWEEKIMSEN